MNNKRPICGHCGKPYGERATHSFPVKWPQGQPMPEYRGNGIVIKIGEPYNITNQETVRRLTMVSPNPALRAYQEADLAKLPTTSDQIAYVDVWDGESYRGGYRPFCTLRCALDYARKAFTKYGNVK